MFENFPELKATSSNFSQKTPKEPSFTVIKRPSKSVVFSSFYSIAFNSYWFISHSFYLLSFYCLETFISCFHLSLCTDTLQLSFCIFVLIQTLSSYISLILFIFDLIISLAVFWEPCSYIVCQSTLNGTI